MKINSTFLSTTLFLALILFSISANGLFAQEQNTSNGSAVKPELPPSMQKGTDMGVEFSIGVNPDNLNNFSDDNSKNKNDFSIKANYIIGHKFNRNIFLGGGIGLLYSKYIPTTDLFTEPFKDGWNFLVPVFIRFKVNFTRTKISPFFSCDFGYAIGTAQRTNNTNSIKTAFAWDIMLNLMLGLDVNFNTPQRRALYVQTGVGGGVFIDGFRLELLRVGFRF